VQDRDEVGLAFLELVAQEVGEEVVVAVPLAARVERNEEEVLLLQAGERLGGALLRERCVAEGRREPLENRGADEERPQLARLALEHLRHEVVDDVAVVAGERLDERMRVSPAAERERGQVKAGSPPLRTLVEQADVVGLEAEAQDSVEERLCLLHAEAEFLRADLEQLPART
jgi:hypothetical protein